MTSTSRSRAKKRLKKGENGYSRAGKQNITRDSNIRRDLSPTTQEIIQEERIYLLITEESDLSVNSDASVEISENMPKNSGNKKKTEAQDNTTVQEGNILTTDTRDSVAKRSDGIRNGQCGNQKEDTNGHIGDSDGLDYQQNVQSDTYQKENYPNQCNQQNVQSHVQTMQEEQKDAYPNVENGRYAKSVSRQDSVARHDTVAKTVANTVAKDTVAKPEVYRSFDGGKSWTEIINGRVDAGAGFSMGSWDHHAQHCIETVDLMGQFLSIRVANGQTFTVRKKGLIHLRINGQVLPPCEILLVDCDTWTNLLISDDILAIFGLNN